MVGVVQGVYYIHNNIHINIYTPHHRGYYITPAMLGELVYMQHYLLKVYCTVDPTVYCVTPAIYGHN